MKLEAVIFDLDGTLIDSMPIWTQVDQDFLSKRNLPVPEDLFTEIKGGNSYREVAEYFKKRFSLPDSIESIMNEWTSMVQEYYEKSVQLKPGAKELLEFLKDNKIKIGIGTSNCLSLSEKVLARNKVIDYFSSLIAGCTGIRGKPYPDIFLKVAEQLEVESKNCLVIEDVLVGVLAAKKAKMDVIAIYDGFSAIDENEIRKKADFYADDFDQIKEIVKLNYLS